MTAQKAGARDLAGELVAELFGVREGALVVGGVSVPELAARFGTPLYVYDAAILRRRLAALRDALAPHVDVYYSMKANPNPDVVRVLVREGAGVEIASAGEHERARAAGVPAERTLFAGPGKSAAELEHVVRRGIGEIHVESDEEIATLAGLARRLDVAIDVAIRVNPSEAAAGGAMRMGGQPAPFGIDEERLEEVARAILAEPRLHLHGVHLYAGTQILDAAVLVGQWRHAAGIGRRFAAIAGRPPRTIDLGGGLGIPYFANDATLDLAAVKEGGAALFDEASRDPALRGTRFIVEPGRWLAGPAGVYVGRVVSVKASRGTTFVVTDAGMHHHLAASGNLGQIVKRDYPLVVATRAEEERSREAVVVGPLCTPLDTLARKARLPAIAAGDLVAVLQSGAYGLTASPVGFLSHPMPAEVLVDGGEARLVRERGTYEHPIVPLPAAPRA